MKPIKLEIEGLNSFETKQVIDFDKIGKGVFGIFGKTGSGKSTILDAITLALYGEVKRSKQNIDFINTKKKKTVVSLDFEIFLLGEKKQFSLTRTFSVKKNGKDVESSAVLYEINNGYKNMLTEGTIKVNDKILEIVGLGKNEFIKCIALPQGEFSAFLSATESERTEILSNIFDLSKYGEALGKRVKQKVSEYELEVNSLNSSLSMVDYATDEELEKSKQKKDEFDTLYKEGKNNLSEKSDLYTKLSSSLEKKKKLSEINLVFAELEKEKPEIDRLEKEIEKNLSANAIKSDYEKLVKGEKDEIELAEKLDEIDTNYQQAEKDFNEKNEEFDNFKVEYDTKMDILKSKISKVTSSMELEKEREKLNGEKEQIVLP